MAKKNLRKIFSILLVIAMVVSLGITALAAESVTINNGATSVSIERGNTTQLTASDNDYGRNDPTFTWASSNTSIATVGTTGKDVTVTGVAVGTVTITVTATKSGHPTTTDTITVNVTAPIPTVSISGSNSLVVPGTITLTATSAKFSGTPTYTWESLNLDKATVNSAGVVTGVAAGNATIKVTATYGSETATAQKTIAVSLKTYDHVDVEMSGTQVISTQNPDSSYTNKTYNIVVTLPQVKINNGSWDNTPSSVVTSGAQREFRFTNLNFNASATVYIKCHIVATNIAAPYDTHAGDLDLAYTATTGFVQANLDCPQHTGLDFTIADTKIIDCLSFDVNYVWTDAPPSGVSLPAAATYLQGNDVSLDTTYTTGTLVEIGSDNYTFSGWFTSNTYTTAAANINDIAADTTFYGQWVKTTDPIEPPTDEDGTLVVSKDVNSDNKDDYDYDFAIDVILTGEGLADYNGGPVQPTVSQGDGMYILTYHLFLSDGDNATFNNLPFGVTYLVAEVEQLVTGWSKSGEERGTFSADRTVTIVNDYESEEPTTPPTEQPTPPPVVINYGSLSVSKTVSGDGASATEKFAITVTFTPGAPDFWNVLGISAPAGAAGGNGVYTLSLSASDGPVTFSNIPVGTTYTVSEAIASTQTGWSEGASTGKTGSITTAGAAAVLANVYAVGVAGASDSTGNAAGSEQGVAGASDVLPQTGGVSSSTLLGLLGLALIAIGGTAFTVLRKKNTGKSK